MKPPRCIRVLCADDHPTIRRLVAKIVDGEPDMETVGVLGDADELLSTVETLAPDVVLLDLSMPGLDPLKALGDLSRTAPDVRVIIFSADDEPIRVERAMACGAHGFVLKDGRIDPLLKAIREAVVVSDEPRDLDSPCASKHEHRQSCPPPETSVTNRAHNG